AQVVVRLDVIGREVGGGGELVNRPRERVGLQIDQAKIDPQGGVRWIFLHQRLVELRSAVVEPELEIGEPEEIFPLLVVRLESESFCELILGLGDVACRQELPSAIQQLQELTARGSGLARGRGARGRHSVYRGPAWAS